MHAPEYVGGDEAVVKAESMGQQPGTDHGTNIERTLRHTEDSDFTTGFGHGEDMIDVDLPPGEDTASSFHFPEEHVLLNETILRSLRHLLPLAGYLRNEELGASRLIPNDCVDQLSRLPGVGMSLDDPFGLGPIIQSISQEQKGPLGKKALHRAKGKSRLRAHPSVLEVKVIGVPRRWRLTRFYGYPVTADRHKSWELLASLEDASFMTWLCVGDFNEVFWADEKLGSRVRNDRQIQGFKNANDYCGLQDLGFTGPKFTWWRNNPEDIHVRLDRALTNIEWSTVFHLNLTKSDHLPIKIIISEQILNQSRRQRRFSFEEMWADHENCADVIRDGWQQSFTSSASFSVTEKLKNTRLTLLSWSRKTFGQLQNDIRVTQAKLGYVLNASLSTLGGDTTGTYGST
ncbi:PREDICTED: reverse mRNAase [Prunus dulcis]|uniref:PREDICTED: reverse mRNAase n=1 Tax=Prunus dulcis TaxID=3755 RepID=A0A5E4FXM2_PRUDU|nr:PREDICTED: reverse mRNAase [Prunus dulcis]